MQIDGPTVVTCRVPAMPLMPDRYSIVIGVATGRDQIDRIEPACFFDVVPRDVYGTGRLPPARDGVLVLGRAPAHVRGQERSTLLTSGRRFHWLPRRARESIRERARFFVKSEQTAELAAELGVPPGPYDLALLQTIASMRALIETRPTVLVDIGAHKGDFTRLAHHVLRFRRIICCEPDADLVPVIQARLKGENATVHCVAISHMSGEMPFYVHADRSMSSLVPASEEILRNKFPTYDPLATTARSVPVMTLDALVAADSLDPKDRLLIKIDTQGNEMDVLAGAEMTLRRTDACLIEFMFCTPYERRGTFPDLVNLMADRGFECSGALDIKRRPSHEVSGVDFLFVSTAASAPQAP
jgi:FkbM family methyltransferase